jgi:hypothetical protein
LSPTARNVAAGFVLQQVAPMVSDEAVKAQIEKLSAALSSTQIKGLFR